MKDQGLAVNQSLFNHLYASSEGFRPHGAAANPSPTLLHQTPPQWNTKPEPSADARTDDIAHRDTNTHVNHGSYLNEIHSLYLPI